MAAGDDIRPFTLAVPDAALADLRARLIHARWPPELPGAGWELGVPGDHVRRLAAHWADGFDWRAQEARLNAVAQFTTTIDGQRVHFLHARSPEPDALPLVITHGWPGSVVEFLDVIGPLSDPRAHGGDPADAFHVVAPSIPGYPLSGPTTERGWHPRRVAAAWATLMERLGYDRYGAQGGDWGSTISRELGILAAEHVVGVHLNMLFTHPGRDPELLAALDQDDRERLAAARRFSAQQSGYLRIQATRPETLAYALNDSPIGLLAWMAEKFVEWSDRPQDIDRDALLTNISLYWLTATAGSAARLYAEHARAGGFGEAPEPSRTPTAVAVFPGDVVLPVRRIAERTNAIARWTEMPRGGHFAALEAPALLVDDVRAFFADRRAPGLAATAGG